VYDRRPPYLLALFLLLAGAAAELGRDDTGKITYTLFKPPQLIEANLPDLAQPAAFYAPGAAIAAVVLGWFLPRWLAGLCYIALGLGGIAYVAWRTHSLYIATNGQFELTMPWDWVLAGGMAAAFIGARAQANAPPRFLLSLLAAAGGAAVLAWMLVPGRPSPGLDPVMHFTGQQNFQDIPITRAFLLNQEFPPNTHFGWYAVWNIFLVLLVLFPVLCLRLPVRAEAWRVGSAESAYAMIMLCLIVFLLLPIGAAVFGGPFQTPGRDVGLPPDWQEGLIRGVNAVRVVWPPYLLIALALVGASEFLASIFASRPSSWAVHTSPTQEDRRAAEVRSHLQLQTAQPPGSRSAGTQPPPLPRGPTWGQRNPTLRLLVLALVAGIVVGGLVLIGYLAMKGKLFK
jgi:hypothetical protein